MKLSGNTILITGGSAGIGFEFARILAGYDNRVIITGRNELRLKTALSQLKNVSGFVSDVSNEKDVSQLAKRMKNEFPELNIVINNAGKAMLYDITSKGVNAFDKAQEEMFTNFFSVIRINEVLLPLLMKQPESAIVNVSSVAAFLPAILVGYSASKAALHSYTMSLRMALENTSNIKVFEVMPPLVNTEFSKEIGGDRGIPPRQVAEEFLIAFQKDQFEIRVGLTEQLYQIYRSSPEEALSVLRGGSAKPIEKNFVDRS